MNADFGQPHSRNRTHSPHQLDRPIVKEVQLGLGIDNHQPVRFGHLRGNFGKVLSTCDANRDWKAKLCAHTTAYCSRNLSRGAEEVCAPSDVGKSLVDRNSLDKRREIIKHINGSIAQPLIILEMPADKDQLRTQLTRPPSRHAAADAK